MSFCPLKRTVLRGFRGGSVVPAKAGDMGLLPPPRRSHMLRSNYTCAPMTELVLRSPGAATTEPMGKDRNRSSAHSLQPAPHSKAGHHREQPAHLAE